MQNIEIVFNAVLLVSKMQLCMLITTLIHWLLFSNKVINTKRNVEKQDWSNKIRQTVCDAQA